MKWVILWGTLLVVALRLSQKSSQSSVKSLGTLFYYILWLNGLALNELWQSLDFDHIFFLFLITPARHYNGREEYFDNKPKWLKKGAYPKSKILKWKKEFFGAFHSSIWFWNIKYALENNLYVSNSNQNIHSGKLLFSDLESTHPQLLLEKKFMS